MSISVVCDLRSRFGAIRDQRSRPTCLAFATSDTHGALFAPFAILSVDFLYYHAVQLMPGRNPESGITVQAAEAALRSEGQPEEIHWPYHAVLPADIAAWRPPTNCPVFKRSLGSANNSFDGICSNLDSRKPVILCLLLSESFYRPTPDGVIINKTPDPNTGKHAVVAVGHANDGPERFLLIRNSWGLLWGLQGHAFLGEGYLANRILSVSTLT